MCWLKHAHVCCHDLHVLVDAGFVLYVISLKWQKGCLVLGGILTVPLRAEQLDCCASVITNGSAARSELTGG